MASVRIIGRISHGRSSPFTTASGITNKWRPLRVDVFVDQGERRALKAKVTNGQEGPRSAAESAKASQVFALCLTSAARTSQAAKFCRTTRLKIYSEFRSASPITCAIFSVVSARMSDVFETASAWGKPASSSSLLTVSIRKRAAIIEEETSS
jgi:hypothetical protein